MLPWLLVGLVLWSGGNPPVRPFGPLQPFALTHLEWARDIGAGDVTGDGLADVALGWDASFCLDIDSKCFIAYGVDVAPWVHGSPGQETTFSEIPSLHVAMHDLDGAGPDEVVVWNLARIVVLATNGTGELTEVVNQFLSFDLQLVEAGDLDHDGDLDLVTSTTTRLYVLENLGGLAFAVQTYFPGDFGLRPRGVLLGDVDGDGHLDLVWTNSACPTSPCTLVSTWLGLGDGTFGPLLSFDTGENNFQLVVADLDADGLDDLVTEELGGVRTWLSRGDGSFHGVAFLPLELLYGGRRIGAAPIDADSLVDVWVVSGGDLHIFPGRGNGHLEPGPVFGDDIFTVEMVDAEGDGDLDIFRLGWDQAGVMLNHAVDPPATDVAGKPAP